MHLGCICGGQSHTLAHYAALLAQIRRSQSEAENERKNGAECGRKRVFRSKTHRERETDSEREKERVRDREKKSQCTFIQWASEFCAGSFLTMLLLPSITCVFIL